MNNRTIKLLTFPSRLILIGVALFILFFVGFVVKWCLAQTVANQTNFKEVADVAVTLAPSDPQTHLTAAVLYGKTFAPTDLEKSLTEYRQATADAPNNYFLWLELGKALEHSGDAAGAESATRHALSLAPNYADVQWALGNLLLRQGNNGEGFALIRQSALANPKYINPAVTVAWQIFAGDPAQIRQNLGAVPPIETALAALLAKEKRFAEAIQIWNAVSVADRQNFTAQGREMYNEMIAAKEFDDALTIYRDLEPNSPAKVGVLVNGDFENEIRTENAEFFEWQVAAGFEPQIGVDNQQKRSGAQSLIVAFNSSDGREFRQITQTITVEAGRKYDFRAFYRASLKTAATVRWEIVNTADGAILGKTEPIAAVSENWTEINAEFVAPAQTQAVILRLVRAECRAAICPISGRVWFDDLTLEKR